MANFTQNAPQLLGGFVSGIAAAGSDQAGATALTGAVNVIATATGTTADGVRLPAGYPEGATLMVVNTTGAAVDVFPSTGGAINGGSANAAVTVPTVKTAMFVSIGSDNWGVVLPA